jgi:hypothetical protein
MKARTVTVSLINPKKQLVVPAIYVKGGTYHYVNGSGELHTIPEKDYIALAKNGGTESLGVKRYVFQSNINNLRKGMKEEQLTLTHLNITFKVNGDTSQEGEIKWFEGHPQAIVDGVSVDSTKPRKFIVTDLNKKKAQKVVDFNEKLEIMTYVNNLAKENVAELQNVLVYLGSSPIDKTTNEIVIELVSPNDGIIFKDNNLEVFRSVFMENTDPNKDLVIGINKGKIYGLLSLSGNVDSKGWYYKQAYCGVTDKDVEVYFTRNKQVFDSMCAEIERIEDKTIPKNDNMIPAAARIEDEKTTLATQLHELVKQGKVEIPEDVLIPTLSVDELKGYINSAKVETKTGFEPRQLSETTVQYKGRLSKLVTKLISEGNLQEPENRMSLKVEDYEKILTEYYNKLGA